MGSNAVDASAVPAGLPSTVQQSCSIDGWHKFVEREGKSKTVDGKKDSYAGNFADAETFPSSLRVCRLGADSPSYMEHKETVKCASRRLPH